MPLPPSSVCTCGPSLSLWASSGFLLPVGFFSPVSALLAGIPAAARSILVRERRLRHARRAAVTSGRARQYRKDSRGCRDAQSLHSFLCADEECKKQGVEFVPACLKNRNKPKNWGDEQRAGRKDVWEPPASDSEESDSGDSMSDLYPAQMFPRKNPEKKEDDEFQTDSDEMEMEIDSTQKDDKRQQRQKGPARKKFKNRHQKSKPYKKPAAK
ncbi:hypothetical protein GDO86_014898 [Hymenochirus boettgeri]|uniref:Surfeit locus protein 2 n=1 Tax=Hymenochirus boettgeri TaxID=247094 RepID=A0A8T2JUI4_9PIPI|nr:hypothetical protein GDO86_014898 [Hymenochirus boettgeri]